MLIIFNARKQSKLMFSAMFVCQFVCSQGVGTHVTVTHDALDLTKQGPPPPLNIWDITVQGPPREFPINANDI